MNGLRVLIVEDEFIVAFELTKVLESMGHEVCPVVASGEQALASISVHQPNCVLLDVNLRGSMTGVELARTIRERYSIAVVFMTGLPVRDVEREVLSLRPAALLSKPIDHDALSAALDGIASGGRDGPSEGSRRRGDGP